MKLKKDYLNIDEIFEIRLHPRLWAQVSTIAKRRGVTYSWVVRYCLFTMMSDECQMSKGMFWAQIASRRLHKKKSDSAPVRQHRHMLCLYGDDQANVRFWALQLRISITELTRIALLLFLPDVMATSEEALLYYGIKRIFELQIIPEPGTQPEVRLWLVQPYPRIMYWPRRL